MSNIARMMQRATAGAGGAGLDVDEVFSTYLYKGTSGSLSINNGIDLSGEGGLVWTKPRDASSRHVWIDTARGVEKYIASSDNTAEATQSGNSLTAFNNNGYTIGNWGSMNSSSYNYVSWTFRKAPKFFDVVTYTGNGTNNQTFNHSLGCVPGMVIIKNTSRSGQDWWVWVNDSITANEGRLNNTGDFGYNVIGTVTDTTVQTLNQNQFATNYSGDSYVAYLFAHNNNDGGFGPDGDQDIIKCGSYTGSSSAQEINVGFEPQFILQKRTDGTSPWRLHDIMRGMPVGSDDAYLAADSTAAEADYNVFSLTPTGFRIDYSSPYYNTSGGSYIYMAIRRGPLAVPEDATKVFSVNTTSGGDNKYSLGFVPDFNIHTRTSGDTRYTLTRLLGQRNLQANNTNALSSLNTNLKYWNAPTNTIDLNTSWWGAQSDLVSWSWKRARGYFDVVATKAVDTNNGDVNHNLGVKPEMAWYKRRDGTDEWYVATAINGYLVLDKSNAANGTASGSWLDAVGGSSGGNDATATTINSGYKFVGNATYDMIIYLFATCPGVSKVGSYTGNGSSQNIDCGFSSGARFVFTKCSSHTGAWHVFDTARGIVSGNDPFLELNSTSAQDSNYDAVDPLSSGFTVSDNITNENGRTFIFYAIA